MNALLTTISTENNKQDHWQLLKVMIKNVDAKRNITYGYTASMKNIVLQWLKWEVGQWCDVLVTGSEAFKLYGEVKKEEESDVVKKSDIV